MTKRKTYEYNNSNGQISKTTDVVGALSNLSGTRDLVTETSFAFQQSTYASMASAHMISQPYETKVSAVRSPITQSVNASFMANYDGGEDEETYDFVVDFDQNIIISYNSSQSNYATYTFNIGTTIGGCDKLNYSGGPVGATEFNFWATTGTRYYIRTRIDIENGFKGPVSASLTATFIPSDPDFLHSLLSCKRIEYDTGKNPYRFLTKNDTDWIANNIILSRDVYGNVIESQNIDGVKSSVIYGSNSMVPVATISNTDRSKVYLKDFEDGLIGGTITNIDGRNTTWSVESGALKQVNYGSAVNQEMDNILFNYGSEVINAVFECDLRVPDTDNFDFTIVMGGDQSTGGYGPEVGVWTAISNETWYYNNSSGWHIIKSGLEVGKKYHFKIVANASTGYVDYYVDGLKMVSNATWWYSTTGYQKVAFGNYGYSTVDATWYIDNIRFYPVGGVVSTSTYDAQTLNVKSITNANGVSTYYEYDGFGRATSSKNDDKQMLTSQAYYLSSAAHSENFSSTDPNFTTSITYTSPTGYSDFSSSSTWTSTNNIQFNIPKAGEVSTVRMGSIGGNGDYLSKPAGIGNTISRVDFYPDNTTTGGGPIVLGFDGGNYRFCVQYLPSIGKFQIQMNTNGISSTPYTFTLEAPINQWYTIEIEKDIQGRCTAWAYKKCEGRNYADMYSMVGYPVSWDPINFSWSTINSFYLANHYVGGFGQSTSYTDGLGRVVQLQTRDGAKNIVSAVEFDPAGRQYRKWRAYSWDTQNKYDDQATTHATQVLGCSNPYSETLYSSDPLSRVETVKNPGTTTSEENTTYSYGIQTLDDGQQCSFVETKQKNTSMQPWIVSKQYSDNLGRITKTAAYQDDLTPTEEIVTRANYTMLGQPYSSTDPMGHITTCSYDFLGRLTHRINPDEGESYYAYDNAGRIRYMIDAVGLASPSPNNKILYWKYDGLGRIIEKGWIYNAWGTTYTTKAKSSPSDPPTPYTWRKQYFYNIVGQLDHVLTNNDDDTYAEVEEYFTYDKYGNTTTKSLKVVDFNSTTSYTTNYQYDLHGRITRMDYPMSSVAAVGATYEYDQVGRMTRVGLAGSTASFATYSYNDRAEMSTETLNPTGNAGAQTRAFVYNTKGNLTTISNPVFTETLSDAGGHNPGEAHYHGLIGNIGSIYGYSTPTPPPAYTMNYEYDKYGRMRRAYGGNVPEQNIGVVQPTIYDTNGNLSFIQHGTDPMIDYHYQNGKNIPQTIGPWTFSADVTGNITAAGSTGTSFSYDPFTQLTLQASKTASNIILKYQYDGRKERIYKETFVNLVSATKTLYLHGLSDFPIMEKQSDGTERVYVYGPTGILGVRRGSSWYFVQKDHLGSTRVMTDVNGGLTARYDYDSYGEVASAYENVDLKYKFTGHEFETEAGFWNFRARMYDSKIGLFYSGDPAHQTNSPYGYAGGNPVSRVDRDGRFWVVPLFIAAVLSDHTALTHGMSGWDRVGYIFQNSAISVGSSLIGYGLGSLANSLTTGWSSTMQSIASGAAGGAGTSGSYSAMTGGNVSRGLISGFITGAVGAAAGTAVEGMGAGDVLGFGGNIFAGGVISGETNRLLGGSFEEGFQSGLLSATISQTTGAISRYQERNRIKKELIYKRYNISRKQLGTWNDNGQKPIEFTDEDQAYLQELSSEGDEIAIHGRSFGDHFQGFPKGGLINDRILRFDDMHITFQNYEGIGNAGIHMDYYGLMSNPLGHAIYDLCRDDWHIFGWGR
jgi:RHS repeat-associated protein